MSLFGFDPFGLEWTQHNDTPLYQDLQRGRTTSKRMGTFTSNKPRAVSATDSPAFRRAAQAEAERYQRDLESKAQGGWGGPAWDMRRAALQQGKVTPGNAGFQMDAATRRAIDIINERAALELAEYKQRVQAADVEAERRRIPIRRNINVQQAFGPLAQQGVSAETSELLEALNRTVPLTQQTYDQGVQAIGDVYNSGAANIANQIAGRSSLAQQLEQLSGTPNDLESQMEGTAAFIQNLLTNAGAANAAGLAGVGQGELAAIRNSLGGYNTEAEQINSDIALQVAAEVQGLNQDLALVQPEFIPFNYGELRLDTEEAIRNALRQGMEDQRAEQEQKRQRYTGLEGMYQFATERGRPQLATALQDMIDASLMQDTGPAGVIASIQNYGRDPNQAKREQVYRLIDQGAPEEDIEALADRLGLNYEQEFERRGGRGPSLGITQGAGISFWPTIRGGSPGERPTRRTVGGRQTAQTQRDIDMLRALYSMYQGYPSGYSNYENA